MIRNIVPIVIGNRPAVILIAIMVGMAGTVYAGGLLALNGVTGTRLGCTESDGVAADCFNGTGRIDRIGRGYIVIDDSTCRLSSHLSCYNHMKQPLPFSVFRAGSFVGYRVNERRQISELWLLPKR